MGFWLLALTIVLATANAGVAADEAKPLTLITNVNVFDSSSNKMSLSVACILPERTYISAIWYTP